MCKYCEEVTFDGRYGYKKFIQNGGVNIVYDPDDVGFLLQIANGCTYPIGYCPWCGCKLEVADNEPEFSPEDEIKRLEGRINHTNTLLCRLAGDLERWVDRDRYNIDMKTEVLQDIKGIRGKL